MNEDLKKEWILRGNSQKSTILHACTEFLGGRMSLVEASRIIVSSDPKSQASFTFVYPEASILDTIIEEHDDNGVSDQAIELRYASEANSVFNFLRTEFSNIKTI